MSDVFRPRVFIGSSSEGLEVADQLQLNLARDCDVRVWPQGVFGVSVVALDELLAEARRVDFAALCLTPDDVTDKRGRSWHSPRDNVIFEAGLFIGHLGRARTFLVHCTEPELGLPSDLLGLTAATYPAGELESSIGSAATKIRAAIAKLRPRELYSTEGREASRDFEDHWRGGARGAFVVEREDGDALLSIRRETSDGEVVVYLTVYRDAGSEAEAIRLEPVQIGRRELRVELDVCASTDCTLLIELKAVDAPDGQYLGVKRVPLNRNASRSLRTSFAITTTAPFRVRLKQRTVHEPLSILEVRRLKVTESIVRE